jgi:hypothetical protein
MRVASCTRQNQWAKNLVVRFATLQRSSIRRGKRIAWCAAAAGRFSQPASNSVSLFQNAQASRPADVNGALCISTLILLAQTPPYFPRGRDECSASGAYYVFVKLSQLGARALLIMGDSFFSSRSRQLGGLTVRHGIPAVYTTPEFTIAGGLMNYALGHRGNLAGRQLHRPHPQGREAG